MDKENKHIKKDRKIPDTFQDLELWQTKRRTFLKGLLLAGAASQISFLQSCKTALENGNDILTAEQATIFKSVLNVLWPGDGNGPGIKDLNSYEYILWVLRDSINRYEEDNQYIIDGINWTNETAEELYFTKYVDLDDEQKEALVGKITIMDWGENWCSAVLTLVLESLVLDPIYGCQPDEVGWKWLNHTPGFPRPTEETRYENLINTANQSKDGI